MKKAEALARLKRLPGWKLSGDGKSIRRDYVLDGFHAAVDFVRRIEPHARSMDHHPDLHLTGYRKLKVVLTTHDAGGLTLKDFRLASRIETLSRQRRETSAGDISSAVSGVGSTRRAVRSTSKS